MSWVNTWFLRDLRSPFGGRGLSGIGREGGDHSLDFYSEPDERVRGAVSGTARLAPTADAEAVDAAAARLRTPRPTGPPCAPVRDLLGEPTSTPRTPCSRSTSAERVAAGRRIVRPQDRPDLAGRAGAVRRLPAGLRRAVRRHGLRRRRAGRPRRASCSRGSRPRSPSCSAATSTSTHPTAADVLRATEFVLPGDRGRRLARSPAGTSASSTPSPTTPRAAPVRARHDPDAGSTASTCGWPAWCMEHARRAGLVGRRRGLPGLPGQRGGLAGPRAGRRGTPLRAGRHRPVRRARPDGPA